MILSTYPCAGVLDERCKALIQQYLHWFEQIENPWNKKTQVL